MTLKNGFAGVGVAIMTLAATLTASHAAGGVDELQNGYELTESFSSELGRDADAFYLITDYSPSGYTINYASSLGVKTTRRVSAADMANASVFMLGYAEGMPQSLPGTTSLGLSTATLIQLRDTGQAPLTLVYNASGDSIPGTLTLVDPAVPVALIVEDSPTALNAVHARGVFSGNNRQAEGDFYFYNNQNNPMALQYSVKFASEDVPRTLRITRVVAGRSQQQEMQQALETLRELDIYGIHFAFDKATILPRSARVIDDIATTLKNNPGWTVRVAGHTDSIGEADYNVKLSNERSAAVIAELVNRHGIDPARLVAAGYGEERPKASNDTLQGRAQNRRVELRRTDK